MRVQTFVELAQVLGVSRQALWRYRKLGAPLATKRGHNVEAWRAWLNVHRPPEPTIEDVADMMALDYPPAEREQVRERIIRDCYQWLAELPSYIQKATQEVDEFVTSRNL